MIPFAEIESTQLGGAYLNMLPLLRDDAKTYSYSFCLECESIFLNPYDGDMAKTYTSTVRPFEGGRPTMEGGFPEQYESNIKPHFEDEYQFLLDAACGAGQYLFLAMDDGDWDRLVGIDLAKPTLDQIREYSNGKILTYQVDLAAPKPQIPMAPYDFVIFSEAFEHVEYPRRSMQALTTNLNPGGKMFFTAQATEGGLPVRPGEPIYTTEEGLRALIGELSLTVIDFKLSAGRWKVVVEKPR
jgi:SAM-dependent methyltransferase